MQEENLENQSNLFQRIPNLDYQGEDLNFSTSITELNHRLGFFYSAINEISLGTKQFRYKSFFTMVEFCHDSLLSARRNDKNQTWLSENANNFLAIFTFLEKACEAYSDAFEIAARQYNGLIIDFQSRLQAIKEERELIQNQFEVQAVEINRVDNPIPDLVDNPETHEEEVEETAQAVTNTTSSISPCCNIL